MVKPVVQETKLKLLEFNLHPECAQLKVLIISLEVQEPQPKRVCNSTCSSGRAVGYRTGYAAAGVVVRK